MSNNPSYLVHICPSCIAIRHFKPKGDGSNIYYCPVCKSEVRYIDGRIERINNTMANNPYGRRGRPKTY